MRKIRAYVLGSVSMLSFATAAHAQEAVDNQPSTTSADTVAQRDDSDDIVVTGTLVRGIAPPGTNVIGVTDKAIQETGASTTAQLLQTIPQLGSFNSLQSPVGGFTNVTTNRPNLRNLPGFSTAGSSPTLVLVDGHRVVGAGVGVTSPDPDIIPPDAIERVEIVPDGGSAIYGSDAVAGVINFITKKKADGLSVGARFGFADSYYSFDANATIGHSWDRGSVYLAYNFAKNDGLVGADRDWLRYPLAAFAGGVVSPSIQCPLGNVTVGGINPVPGGVAPPSFTYGLPYVPGTSVAGQINRCDPSDNATLYPAQRRHSVLLGLTQEINDDVTLDVRAFYTNRRLESNQGNFLTSTSFGPGFLASFGFFPTTIFNVPTPTYGGLETQTINYSLGGSNFLRHVNTLETWGLSPTFTARLGDNWRLRVLASYGRSTAVFRGRTASTAALSNAISAGLINPYNLSASNPAAMAAALNYEEVARTRQRQLDLRAVIDGDLFELPGGAVKLAAGAEYISERFTKRNGTIFIGTEDTGFGGLAVNGTLIAPASNPLIDVQLNRNVKSLFGEIVVPIFGTANATGGMQELTFSAAGRYDSYSDFGGTFNPKLGLTWRPVDSLKFRAAWGKSFVAPSLADSNLTTATSANFVNLSFLLPPAGTVGAPPSGGRGQLVILGNKPGISSQNARTWSLGVDFDPTFVPGLHLGVTYWNIDYRNIISIPNFTSSTFYANFIGTPAVTFNPTPDELAAAIQGATISGTSCGGNPPGVTPLQGCYVIIDARKQNLGRVKLSGLDFAVNYYSDTGFGSIDFSLNANYELKRDQQATSAAPFIDQLAFNNSRFRMRTALGAQIGALRAQVTWNHNHGYNLFPAIGYLQQTRVDSFNVFDLFFKYDLKGDGALKDTSLTLNVNNVFDQDPPNFEGQSIIPANNGYANGATLGRFVQFGFNKRF